MQRTGATPTQNAAPYFLSFSNFGGSSNTIAGIPRPGSSSSRSRPGTSSGEPRPRTSSGAPEPPPPLPRPNVLTKERRPSLSRKSSFSKRRASSSNGSAPGGGSRPGITIVTDVAAVPPLPDFQFAFAAAAAAAAATAAPRDGDVLASPASAESFSKMLTRTAPLPANGYAASSAQLAPPVAMPGQTESTALHQHILETANKRISTLDYLRKA